MLRWAAVPAVVFAVSFCGSLAYFALDDDAGPDRGTATATPAAPAGDGRLAVSYTPTVDDADHGYLGSIRLDGSDLRNVIEPPGTGATANGSPSVAPNGRTVAFQRAVARPGRPGEPHIYVIPLDGSRPERRVTGGRAPEVDPAWSPDGERIAFARLVNGHFDLFSVRTDGSGARQLTDTPGVDELSPAWSPDGSRLAFSRYENGLEHGSGDLWTSGAGGGHERMLLGDVHDYTAPAWSPDGSRIALLKDSLVAVVDADGGAPRPITRGGDLKETRPSWSPDGTKIAFTRDPGKILTMDPDGSHVKQIPFERSANGVDWVPAR
jgi:Tol biopolymer transport system component